MKDGEGKVRFALTRTRRIGKALFGTGAPLIPDDGEGPLRTKAFKPFRVMQRAVGNAQIAEFVEQTGDGLYDIVGHVWEWTADAYRMKALKKHVQQKLDGMKGFKALKGGSFLCHRSYFYRYRIAALTGNSPDTTTSHQGFRVAWDER